MILFRWAKGVPFLWKKISTPPRAAKAFTPRLVNFCRIGRSTWAVMGNGWHPQVYWHPKKPHMILHLCSRIRRNFFKKRNWHVWSQNQESKSQRKLAAMSLPVPNNMVCAISHFTRDISKPGTEFHGVTKYWGVSSRYIAWLRSVPFQGAESEKLEYVYWRSRCGVRACGLTAPHWSHTMVDW